MKPIFPAEWRTKNPHKRRFYARYMVWLERLGYLVVACVIGAFIYAFNYKVDETISASGVAIEPRVTPIVNEQDCFVIEVLQPNQTIVEKGAPLFTVVQSGADVATTERAWIEFRSIYIKGANNTAMADWLKAPDRITIRASVPGLFIFDKGIEGDSILEGEPIGRIVDFSQLYVNPSLAGQSAPAAKIGQTAKIYNIVFEPAAGSVFRGAANGKDAISGSIVGPELKELLQRKLEGKALTIRDDLPMSIEEVTDVAIDAEIGASSTNGESRFSDPTPDFSLKATVIEGTHNATVQLADLPPDLQAEAKALIEKKLKGKSLQNATGESVSLDAIQSAHFVLKMKAKAGSGSGAALRGAALSRSFDAKLNIENPPQFLLDAVKEAYLAGRKVTAKVELSTGVKPIVSTLLKKS